jgi:beta-glucanase (GH16 family)
MVKHSKPTMPFAKPAISSKSAYKLVFHDEFNAKGLDKSKWNTCYDSYDNTHHGCTNYGNDESEWYKPSQVTVANGNMTLTAQKKPTEGIVRDGNYHTYPYASGMVSTGRYLYSTPEKWSGKYGYYEARMKVPSGQGIWPAFWLLPVEHTWPPEIDVMELLGNKPNQILTTYFWKDGTGNMQRDSSPYTAPTSFASSWHTYAIDWEKGTIDWYIDGKNIKHVSSANVPSINMQIIFDLAVGGRLPGYPDVTTPATAKMIIDYVRVYNK